MATKTPPRKTQLQAVYDVMSDGCWWTPFSIQNTVAHNTGKYYSESATTARIRDLRKTEHGAFTIEARRVKGKHYYEYRMVK